MCRVLYLSDLNLRKLICPEAKQQTKPFYRLENFQNIYFATSTHIHFAWRPDRLRLRLRFRPWFWGRGRSRGTWIPELISVFIPAPMQNKNNKHEMWFGVWNGGAPNFSVGWCFPLSCFFAVLKIVEHFLCAPRAPQNKVEMIRIVCFSNHSVRLWFENSVSITSLMESRILLDNLTYILTDFLS